MSQETVKLNRKLFGSALVNVAELLVQTQGQRYSEALFDMFSKGGLDVGVSHGALRDWVGQQPGWQRRYAKALETFEQRKAGLDPNHPELRRLERQVKTQAGDLTALREKLDVADKKQTVFEQLQDTLDEVVEPLEPVPFISVPPRKSAHPVDMVVQLTDEHADEIITGPTTWGLERYNYDVFCLRLEVWQRLVIEYATGRHLPEHNVERVHIFKTGDTLHGDIHGNKHRNHFANTMRAAVAVADAEAEAIAGILEHVPYVSMVCVSGNHPRTTVKKDYADPHDNFDFMIAALITARLAKYISDGRLDIHAPRAWSAFVDVRGKVMALNHGDDVKGTWGIPWYGFAKKEARVQALVARREHRVSYFWYGHFHTDMAVTETGARSVHGAAFTTTDGYALNAVNAGGEPMQPAMILDDHPGMRGRLLDLPIWLRHTPTEDAFWAGKIKPKLGRTGALSVLSQADEAAGGGKFPLIRTRK